MSDVRRRALASLPTTELSWLHLRDHFVATVGHHAGTGRPLGPLLVLADATFAPRSRFPLHPHREMEILSLVIDGELSHHGDQANGTTLRPREAQLISARSGMVHAEGNDTDRETRMLQIWFEPETSGGAPAYFQRTLALDPATRRQLVAGDEGMPLRSSARVSWLDLAPGHVERLELAPDRIGYLMALDGPVTVGATRLVAGEGAEVRGEADVSARDRPVAALFVDVPTRGRRA